jgi:hypothetical protein
MRRRLRGTLRSHRSIWRVCLGGFKARISSFAERLSAARSGRKRNARTFNRRRVELHSIFSYFTTHAGGVAAVSRPVRQLRSQR